LSAALVQIDDLDGVGLDELNCHAALQTRTDRKYLVTPAQLDELLDRMAGDMRARDIAGRRGFRYESLYFDTPDFDSYLGAARRRPDRFKVRTRRYLDADGCWVEVKLRNRHGQTVKHRHPHEAAEFGRLSAGSLAFVSSFPRLADIAHRLEPAMTTHYRRSTLLIGASRATIDVGVTCTANGRTIDLGDAVIVETKSEGVPSPVDRTLWDLHVRPGTISKFCLGVAALHPELPSNKWHRTLRCHVHVSG
jgi:VTC domain